MISTQVKPKDGIWEGLLDDAINHHRPPAIVALTNLVRLVMWRNLVIICVEIKILWRVRIDLHAIDATPARWRGDAGSSPLDGAITRLTR